MRTATKVLKDMWVDYPERPRFTYWDVYKLIMDHSTLGDRLDPKKMVIMSVIAFDIFIGIQEMPKKKKWNMLEEFKDEY